MVDWKHGEADADWASKSILELYNEEKSYTNVENAAIGLMYLYDYYYSINGCEYESEDICQTSWIHLSNNDNTILDDGFGWAEWTMTSVPYSSLNEGKRSVAIFETFTSNAFLSGHYNIRPVFYLTTNVKYVSGSATLEDPILLN